MKLSDIESLFDGIEPRKENRLMSPLEAIRTHCVECVGGNPLDVKDCGGDTCQNGGCDKDGVCWFFPYRLGKGRPSVKLIRRMCLWCMGDSVDFVRDCWTPDCPLHPYRMGTNPNFSEETRKKRRGRALKQGLGVPAMLGSSA